MYVLRLHRITTTPKISRIKGHEGQEGYSYNAEPDRQRPFRRAGHYRNATIASYDGATMLVDGAAYNAAMMAMKPPTMTPPVPTIWAAAPVKAETVEEAVMVTLLEALADEALSQAVQTWDEAAEAEELP
jgi:hypothetical protein